MSYRLGVDVGGTFTDLLLINEDTGETFTAKVPSTPQDSSIGVLNGIARICEESGVDVTKISRVMHGTTVATNAVLTGKGSKVALVTTKGYKQVLQVARSFCPGGLGGWVSYIKKPLLAPLELTIEADERIGADGSIVSPLHVDAFRASLLQLKKRGGFAALTICFINSYVNGEHERQAKQIAAEIFPDMPISISSDIVPEMQEYERTQTTVVNSYVRPEVARYVDNLQQALVDKMGADVHLSILRSDGGLASARAAADNPVNLLMSGPAGGVAGAIHFCKEAGHNNILTFDMGGTSTDVALIQDAKARIRRETRVGDVTVRAPSIDIRTVGAGGGSLAFVPELTKALRVGPESAGAVPGPAAYMKGGEEPTVCDANVVLGYLPADVQLGGKMAINKAAAVAAVKKVADAMGLTVEEAAEGIVKIVNEAMFGALRLVSVEQGFDPRDFALVGFGGAGPLHANALGILSQAWPTIIPPGPGVLCAYGDATTQVRDEASRTYVTLLKNVDEAQFKADLQDLASRAKATLQQDGLDSEAITLTYQADVRYTGQAFQLSIEFSEAQLAQHGTALLKSQFDAEHTQLFTFALEDGHEVVMIRAVATAKNKRVPVRKAGSPDASLADCKITDSEIYFEGRYHPTPIYAREKLHSQLVVDGPAIVCEMDSTTVVLPGYRASVDHVGNLLINPA
ncbi:hydantoinase/oxoprolinase family protein [Alishewanella sp. SMS8]|uniref:hydantoinase/oxoprolinase family protein n=1 Tax=Alishewanella sp. SMS8 TaxID=2994676 RepID=UPI002740DBA0|nr:hydantoinase/oxoprolinase family protein [Alishewanella sp. SMS8]MDP5035051.1 hydantoinase/oxoprolinase family protein [Alishewanella sp.]MDP5187471.1 hydantoinase/oxoprolinase family protein [Alishewanella sp.]MDP5460874.1 hydantoinase/oxoprolinase family protein [Alishewanella sp. SMS8]